MSDQATPELTIPIVLDYQKALEELKQLRARLGEAGDAGEDGFERARGSARGLGDVLTSLATHQGYQMVKDLASAMSDGFKESAEYVKEVSREFTDLRTSLQEIAALQGRDNSGSFTTDQARAAASAGLKPEEWVKFQSAFQSVAGAYIEGPDARMGDDQAEEFQRRLAQFAKAKGVAAEDVAELGGSILQFADGPIDPDEAMARAGRAFRTLERARTKPSQLMKPMTGVMAMGADADEAAQLLNLAGEIKPGEEEVYVTNPLKALDKLILDGRGEELGLRDGMSPLEKIRAASEALAARAAGGEDMNAMLSDYAKDMRERRGLEGFVNRGVLAGGFDRVAGYIATTPADYADRASAGYAASDEGRAQQAQADLARNRIERGYRNRDVVQARTIAEAELTREGRFERMDGVDDAARRLWGALPIFGSGVSVKDQLINERATQSAFQQAYTKGADVDGVGQLGQTGLGFSQSGFAENFLRLMQMTADNTGRLAAAQEKQAQRPLNAAPPDPRTRP